MRPRAAGLAALALALAASVALWIVRPLPDAHSYDLGVQAGAILLLVWASWFSRPTARRLRLFSAGVAVAGLAVGVARLRSLDAHAEVVRTYHSLFDAMARGADPYSCRCILHVTPAGDRLGDFNYPPGEIWPYQAVHAMTGSWDVGVLATVVAGLNALAFLILLAALPRTRRRQALALLPLVVLWEVRTTIGATMVLTASILAVVVLGERARRPWHRPALWVLFGVGLVTKFAVIPLFVFWACWTAAGRWRDAPPGGRLGRLGASALDAAVPAALAALLCLPAGVGEVARSTLLFNAHLGDRARLTTFYPNALSGLTRWAGAQALYPFVAVSLLVAVVLFAVRMPLLAGMLAVTTAFLLVSPTPEPQFVPLVALVLMAALAERDGRQSPAPVAHGSRRAPQRMSERPQVTGRRAGGRGAAGRRARRPAALRSGR